MNGSTTKVKKKRRFDNNMAHVNTNREYRIRPNLFIHPINYP